MLSEKLFTLYLYFILRIITIIREILIISILIYPLYLIDNAEWLPISLVKLEIYLF